jgi:hypothetical protein
VVSDASSRCTTTRTWQWLPFEELGQLWRHWLVIGGVAHDLDGRGTVSPDLLKETQPFFHLRDICHPLHDETKGQAVFNALCTTLPMIWTYVSKTPRTARNQARTYAVAWDAQRHQLLPDGFCAMLKREAGTAMASAAHLLLCCEVDGPSALVCLGFTWDLLHHG